MRSRNSSDASPSDRARRAWTVLAVLLSAGLAAAAGLQVPKESDISPQKPVEIRSRKLTFERETGLTRFTGDVRVKHGDLTLSADEVRAASGNRQATAEGNVSAVDQAMAATLTCGHLEYRDLMRIITAHDDPLLVSIDEQGRPVSIASRQMEFFSEQRTAVANQSVVVTSAEGYAVAGKAVLLQSKGEILLEKEPKVFTTQGDFSGRKLRIGLTDHRFVAEGGVEVKFYPTPQARIPVPPAGTGTYGGEAGKGTGSNAPNDLPAGWTGVPTGPGANAPVPEPTPIPRQHGLREGPGW